MAITSLPNSVMLYFPSVEKNHFVYRKNDSSVGDGIDSVFSPVVKVAVEQSTADSRFVNLRFTYNNKYWQKNAGDNSIVAVSSQKVEDTTDPSCTLFEATVQSGDEVYFVHVQTGWPVVINNLTRTLYVDQTGSAAALGFVDGSTIVQLPTNIALKGNNAMYLKAYAENSWYLQFQESDANNELSVQTVTLMPNGYVRILSNHFGKFWWTDTSDSDQWVHADWDDSKGSETTSYFWPVKIDDTTIALRSAANNNYCKRLTTDSTMTDCLAAAAGSITDEAKMQVQELVSHRKIYNVAYRMEDAMIYGETPFLAATATLTNNKDEEASMEITVTYQSEISYTFSRGTSLTAGLSVTMEAGIPLIGDAGIQISFDINKTLDWDTTITTKTSDTATGTVTVPANSTVTVKYVGTRGTCNIPYSYTQEDISSTTVGTTIYQRIDGIYNGVSCYNFIFQVEPLQST
ncbi:uncharacterized protein LOC125204991 [Salvia hispanica]|uniref:uncharacterized protein LOC125204991 n=1 Tax=Salvia hispanica TaxID=49212 RepID=UPI0020099308|nr:uncharacterized protein LOC125204991 [Salvia hispanica]